ncbi:MAG: hypothetical protein OEQ53_01260 [Saprospiraceae bacterium]|nr:hypothetical protein [Saprospiraceae bacterium]
MKRSCQECGVEFFGRRDKKFCSDPCRNSFNNRLNRDPTNYVRNVNRILRKNRRILSDLNPKGKTKIHRDKLVEKGFNFKYYTNQYVTKAGNTYHFCYDQGYLELEDYYFALVVRQKYVDR